MATNCLYCERNQLQKELMIEICDLEVSTLFLFREQTYAGRCVVAYKEHDVELYQLSDSALTAFMKDVNRVAKTLKTVFQPAKVNYGAYSDKLPHLHIHLVPKYEDGPDFGGTFTMNPAKQYLSEEEYREMAAKIQHAL